MKSATTLLTAFGIAACSTSVFAWTPGTITSPMPSKGFTVNTNDRNDVIAFWHAVYQASEGYENRIQWTGDLNATNHATGKGTVSAAFVKDVERRINFLRALSGAPAHASVNTGSKIIVSTGDPHQAQTDVNASKAEANQASAYMIARAYQANSVWADPHDAPTTAVGWTGAAWNATKKSNITQGFYGPGAMDAYVQENESGSSDNSAVGHRRWMLLQNASDYATGDTPGLYDPSGVTNNMVWRLPTNSLYVLQRQSEEIDTTPKFATYPGAGFFPAPLNTRWWSISHPDADFSGVTSGHIRMWNSANTRIGTTMKSNASTPGDPTLSWDVVAAARVTSVTQDTTFRVAIDNIKINGAVIPTVEYTVTLINPNQITSDQTLEGSATAPSTGNANYFFTRPTQAEAVEAGVFTVSNTSWTETAEADSDTVVPNVSTSYNFRSVTIPGVNPAFNPLAGSFSYRLTHPVRLDIMAKGVPEQGFQLAREIIANAGTPKLTFQYRRGYMGPGSSLLVQYSEDGGANWNTLGNPIVGLSSTLLSDNTTQSWEGTFPVLNKPLLVRFRYYRSNTGAAVVVHSENPALPTGMFIDSISTSGCSWLKLEKTTPLAANATFFTFNAENAGLSGSIPNGNQYQVRLRTKLGNRWFPYGPAKTVTSTTSPVAGYNGWLAYEFPGLTGGFSGSHSGDGIPNGIKYGFMLDPLVASAPIKDTFGTSATRAKNGVQAYISISRAAEGIRDGAVGAEWSDTLAAGSWSSVGVTVTYSDATKTAIAEAPAGTGKRFLRWKVTSP